MSLAGVTTTNRIRTQLELEAAQFVAGAKKANQAIDGLIRGNLNLTQGAVGLRQSLLGINTASALAAAGIIGVGLAVATTITKAVQLGGELFDLSQRTGETVEALSALKFAAEQEGVALGEVTAGLRVLTNRAGQAASGSEEATKAFKKYGVEIRKTNGELKAGSELLEDIGKELAKLPPGAERTAAATALLGRSGQRLAPLAINLAQLRARFEELGGTISTEFATRADTFGDIMGEIRFLFQRAGIAIAEIFLPSLIELAEFIVNDLAPQVVNLTKNVKEFQFFVFQTAKTIGLLAGAGQVVNGVLTLNVKEFERGAKAAKSYWEQLGTTRQEWEEMNKLPPITFDRTGDSANEIAGALGRLNEEFKTLGNEDVEATKALAESFANMGAEGIENLDKMIAKLEGLSKGIPRALPPLTLAPKEFAKALKADADASAEHVKQVVKALKAAREARAEAIRQLPVEQMKKFADTFRNLDKEAIAPVLAAAKELAGDTGLGALGERFATLVIELERMAVKSDAAKLALEGVLEIQRQAMIQQAEIDARVQGPVTREGVGPTEIRPPAFQIETGLAEGQGPVQGPVTAEGEAPQAIQQTQTGVEGIAHGFEQAAIAATGFNDQLRTMEDLGAAAFMVLDGAVTAFADGLITSIDAAAQAVADFFKTLLQSFAKAIIRATILAAIMSIITGGGFSIKNILKSAAGSVLGPLGFQDNESSMLGKSAQARGSLLSAVGGQQLATASGLMVPSVTVTPKVEINNATPMTWARVVDDSIMPRLRTRVRRLHDDLG
jgi:hypothetical protein